MKFDKLFLLREASKPKKINIDATKPDEDEDTSEDYYAEIEDEETDYGEDAPEDEEESTEEDNAEEETEDTDSEEGDEEPTEDEPTDYGEDAPEDTEEEEATDEENTEDSGEDTEVNADATDEGGEDELTDYGADAPEDTESTSDSDSSDDNNTDTTDETNQGNSEDNKRNLTLFKDMSELYTSIKSMMQKIEDNAVDDLIILKVLRQVRTNLGVLSEQIFNYLVNSFNSSNYITNLYNYNLFKEALSLNVEMLTKINKIRNDKGKQSSKNIYK